MLKVITLLVRKPGLSREEFLEHWRKVHAPIAHAVQEVRRYHLNIVTEEPRSFDMPAGQLKGSVDGIAELWFESRADFAPEIVSEERRRWREDNAHFIGDMHSFIVEEDVVIP